MIPNIKNVRMLTAPRIVFAANLCPDHGALKTLRNLTTNTSRVSPLSFNLVDHTELEQFEYSYHGGQN